MSAKSVVIAMLLLLPALAGAQPAATCPQSRPLSEDQLTELLKGKKVPETRVGQLVASCGIEFEPDEGVIRRLRSAGAPQTVLAAVRAATGPAERKRQAEHTLWDSIKDSQDPTVFQDYLRRYPEGQFAMAARQKYGDLMVAAVRAEVERALAGGRWDAAEGKVRDLLRVIAENDEIRGWQRRIAEGREKLRLASEAAARAPVRPAALAAGTKKVNPKDGLTYVWIPAGTFMMGCSPGDNECFDDEKPAHQVTVTKGFWLGQTPVTQQAWQRVTGKDSSNFKGANLPVETVSWDESKAYCSAIGGRLPTEAEWEYAARAGSTGARYGNLDEIAWYSGNSGGHTREVAQKTPNAWGLCDMLGNVWQWVADWYGDYPSGAQSDPSGPAGGQYRALRGGSWNYYAGGARVSRRLRCEPGLRFNFIGLRCVGE
jgi:formylglycine-generating enzyme required for sulfatase activity